jgi:hypothetical protein
VHQQYPLFAIINQRGLWEAFARGIFLPFGGISAMPSMHVAAAILFALVGWEVNRLLGLIFVLYAYKLDLST